MQRLLRQAWRMVIFGGFTPLCLLVLLATTPFVLLFGGNLARWRARATMRWSRVALRILGIRLEVEGPVPEPPFVLVTNHLGYVDIVVLASQAPLTFVAKAEVAHWPFFGLLTRSTGTIFIDRARARDIPQVLGDIEAALAQGIGVVVFAEATSSPGAEVLRFRPSLLESAARARLPVAYGALSYRTPPGEPPAHVAVCWWDDTPFTRHVVRLFGLRACEARIRFGARRIVEEDRKLLAEQLHHEVSSLFEPTVTQPFERDGVAAS